MTAWIAWADGDGVVVDGELLTSPPRGRRWGVTAYVVGPMPHRLLERWVHDASGSAYASRDGASRSYRIPVTGRAALHLVEASAWGLSSDRRVAAEELLSLADAVEAEGWGWSTTVASLAGRVGRICGAVGRQLAPRWRAMAHAAIHQGPIVVARGGSPDAVALDRRQAFLSAMDLPMPTGWTTGILRWAEIRETDGLVHATVRARDVDLPPLPIRRGGVLHPHGRVTGTWRAALVEEAESAGLVDVERVHAAIVPTDTEPIYAPVADRIRQVESKELRKRLYTRFWGRLARIGGWSGAPGPSDGAEQWIGSTLWWAWKGHGGLAESPPDYRPDHAAWIATSNAIEVARAVRRVPAGGLVAAHVDCLWIDRAAAPELGDGWARKGEGPLRIYAPGVYVHGDHLAASGCATAPSTAADVAAWASRADGWIRVARAWQDGRSCADSADAVSRPVLVEDADGPMDRYALTDPAWTALGWMRKNGGQNPCADIGPE